MAGNDPEYMKEYRERNPDYKKDSARKTKARGRALTALAIQHPAEYRKLFEEHLAIIKREEDRGTR